MQPNLVKKREEIVMRKGWIVDTLQWTAKISSDFENQSLGKPESSPYLLLESNLCGGEPIL